MCGIFFLTNQERNMFGVLEIQVNMAVKTFGVLGCKPLLNGDW